MTDITEAQKSRNRAAYDKLEPALNTWRTSILGRVEKAKTCQHVYRWVGNVEACEKCGESKKLAEKEEDNE